MGITFSSTMHPALVERTINTNDRIQGVPSPSTSLPSSSPNSPSGNENKNDEDCVKDSVDNGKITNDSIKSCAAVAVAVAAVVAPSSGAAKRRRRSDPIPDMNHQKRAKVSIQKKQQQQQQQQKQQSEMLTHRRLQPLTDENSTRHIPEKDGSTDDSSSFPSPGLSSSKNYRVRTSLATSRDLTELSETTTSSSTFKRCSSGKSTGAPSGPCTSPKDDTSPINDSKETSKSHSPRTALFENAQTQKKKDNKASNNDNDNIQSTNSCRDKSFMLRCELSSSPMARDHEVTICIVRNVDGIKKQALEDIAVTPISDGKGKAPPDQGSGDDESDKTKVVDNVDESTDSKNAHLSSEYAFKTHSGELISEDVTYDGSESDEDDGDDDNEDACYGVDIVLTTSSRWGIMRASCLRTETVSGDENPAAATERALSRPLSSMRGKATKRFSSSVATTIATEEKRTNNRSSPLSSTLQPCRYGAACTRSDCWFDHPSTRPSPKQQYCTSFGGAGGGGGGGGPRNGIIYCRFGSRCTRRDCWYEHPPQWIR